MTNSLADIVVKACPNPFCEAHEREGDFRPAVRLHHFGRYRVVCTSCILEGPLRSTKAEAIAAWNTRTDPLATLVLEAREVLEPFVRHGRAIGVFDGDDGPFWIMTDTGRRDVPAEHFRQARATLAKLESL